VTPTPPFFFINVIIGNKRATLLGLTENQMIVTNSVGYSSFCFLAEGTYNYGISLRSISDVIPDGTDIEDGGKKLL